MKHEKTIEKAFKDLVQIDVNRKSDPQARGKNSPASVYPLFIPIICHIIT